MVSLYILLYKRLEILLTADFIIKEDKTMNENKTNDVDAISGERWFPQETTIIDDMKNLWGDWGVSSEVDTLKAVLVRRPGKEIENFDWQAARFKSSISPEKFRAQHDSLINIYKDHGVNVHYVEETKENRPNALFCRDLMLMTPEGAIVTRPAMEARRGEERYVAKKLADIGVPIIRTICGGATFETNDNPSGEINNSATVRMK